MKEREDYIFNIIGFGILALVLFFGYQYNSNKQAEIELKYKKLYVENMDFDHFYTMEDECLTDLKENFIPKSEEYNYDRFCENERERAEQDGYDLVQDTVEYLQDFDIDDYVEPHYKP